MSGLFYTDTVEELSRSGIQGVTDIKRAVDIAVRNSYYTGAGA